MKYIQLIRPHQWLKNIFIFLPLFFDKHLFDISYIIPTVITFVSFCFLSSSIYCFNDIIDYKADQLHPEKKKRPIASGKVSVFEGYIVMFVLLFLSIGILLIGGNEKKWSVLGVLFAYFILNIFYCLKLKQIAIVDVFIIATGFVLRVLAGGFSTGIVLTHWIVLTTFLLACFLGFAKRRDDLIINKDTGVIVRNNINRYSLDFLNLVLAVLASIIMVCYVMYTVSDEVISRMGSNYVSLTSIFVLAGIIRYLQLTLVDAKSGSPTDILINDRFIQCCLAGWIINFVIIIYLS